VFRFFIGGGELIVGQALETNKSAPEVAQLDGTSMCCIRQKEQRR